MSKIPFTLQAWLKDKSQKVETRSGRIVHDIWPVEPLIVKGERAEVCALIDGEEDALMFFTGGKYLPVNAESPFDLFIITPEEELSEFEKVVKDRLWRTLEYSETFREDENKWTRKLASELLSLAREQLIKDGYVIEKKAFHDAVKKVSPEVMKEVSENIGQPSKFALALRNAMADTIVLAEEKDDDEMSEIVDKQAKRYAAELLSIAKEQLDIEILKNRALALTKQLNESGLDENSIEYELIEFMCNLMDCPNWSEIVETAGLHAGRIKAEAVKDLPRWVDDGLPIGNAAIDISGLCGFDFIRRKGKLLRVSDLEKLPGFKEI